MRTLFDDTEKAYSIKSDTEIERASFIFKMIANEPLVRIGTAVTNFAIKAHLPVEGLIRATVFDHFCGGVSEKDCLPTIDKMYAEQVYSILDYSVEGKEEESQFDFAVEKILKVIEFVNEKEAIPFAVFKPTAFGRLKLYQKVSDGASLSRTEEQEYNRIKERYVSVCQKAFDLDVALLIDAEESWMQDAADDLALEMMRKYNQEKTIVYNTAQMYRHDRLTYLKYIKEIAKKENFRIGIKVVRGAYLEKENQRAIEKNYPSPICPSKTGTDRNFDEGVGMMVDNLDVFGIFLGTHNENSTYRLMELMTEREIAKDDHRIWFGQLYGMSDNISFNLASEGYFVAKYLPYGPVRDVMPYLIRRAEENTSVAGQTSRELDLINKEKKRRRLITPTQ